MQKQSLTFKYPVIIFYDGTCGFCERSVFFFLKRDKKNSIYFSPLQGKTAEKELKPRLLHQPIGDTVVVLCTTEKGPSISFYSRAIFRLFWELGGAWKALGVLAFFPNWALSFFDFFYRYIAKRRHRFCPLPSASLPYKEKYLP